jgi:hypothetical protein
VIEQFFRLQMGVSPSLRGLRAARRHAKHRGRPRKHDRQARRKASSVCES